MPRKINLQKIRESLKTECPLCHQVLNPPEWMRVDGERIKCGKCGGVFVELLNQNDVGSRFSASHSTESQGQRP
jgi:ribosomal protein S27AE